MLSKKTINQLDLMIDKTFHYGGQIHCILGYKVDEDGEKVTIRTNIKPYTKSFESVHDFLGYFIPTSDVQVIPPETTAIDPFADSRSRADKMIALLEESIEKVKVNPGYIAQATSINNNVNSIINIEKMRLAMMKKK